MFIIVFYQLLSETFQNLFKFFIDENSNSFSGVLDNKDSPFILNKIKQIKKYEAKTVLKCSFLVSLQLIVIWDNL